MHFKTLLSMEEDEQGSNGSSLSHISMNDGENVTAMKKLHEK